MTNPAWGHAPWLKTAAAYLGEKEIKGPHHNPKIVALWKDGKAGAFKDDETPWCAAFVSAVLEKSDIVSARTGWARGYSKWGDKLHGPAIGAVAVLSRGPKFGHVGFVVGRTKEGLLLLLGGNQGDTVSIAAFDPSRVLSYRWPKGVPMPMQVGWTTLPVSTAKRSTSEA